MFSSSTSSMYFVILSVFLLLLAFLTDKERSAVLAQQNGDNNTNTTSTTSNPDDGGDRGSDGSDGGGGLSAGAYVGIAFGVLIFILVVSFICWRRIRRRN